MQTKKMEKNPSAQATCSAKQFTHPKKVIYTTLESLERDLCNVTQGKPSKERVSERMWPYGIRIGRHSMVMAIPVQVSIKQLGGVEVTGI